jgi:phosphoglycolate phosphatase
MSLAPRSVIFDLDGTILDSKTVILDCFGQAVETVFPGRRFDLQTVRLGPPLRRMFQIAFPQATESQLEEMLRTFRLHYDRDGPIKTLAFDGAEDVLAYFQNRGVTLFVATNKPQHISRAILEHLRLDHYFRAILAIDSAQPPFASKADMVWHLLEAHQLNPAETWCVGDAAEDAAAAFECKLPFVWAAYGYGHLGEKETASVFRTINTLKDLIGPLPCA